MTTSGWIAGLVVAGVAGGLASRRLCRRLDRTLAEAPEEAGGGEAPAPSPAPPSTGLFRVFDEDDDGGPGLVVHAVEASEAAAWALFAGDKPMMVGRVEEIPDDEEVRVGGVAKPAAEWRRERPAGPLA